MDITIAVREFDVEAMQKLSFGAYDPMTSLSAFESELEKIAGFGSMLGKGLEAVGGMFGRVAKHMPSGGQRSLLEGPAEGVLQRGFRNAGEVAQDLGTRVSARAATSPSLAQRAGQVVGAGDRALSGVAQGVGNAAGGLQKGVDNLVGGVRQIGTDFRAGRAGINPAAQGVIDTAAKGRGMEFGGQISTPANISGSSPAVVQPQVFKRPQQPVSNVQQPVFSPVGTTAGEQALAASKTAPESSFFQRATGFTPAQASDGLKSWYSGLSPEARQKALMYGGIGASGVAAGFAANQAMN